MPGDFHFSFRHFQVLSNELVTPKLLVCPADTRPPATNFAGLRNEFLSYFVGIKAEYAQPDSILAGDRNLTNDYVRPTSLVRLDPNHTLRWTRELHEFKGNVLFADGRVEEKNSLILPPMDLAGPADLVFPSVPPPPSLTGFTPAVRAPAVGGTPVLSRSRPAFPLA